jgi:hypothetical protein
VLDIEHHDDVLPPDLQVYVDELLPAGVTYHGELHLLRGQPSPVMDPWLEVLWEHVRRADFPDAPSRYQSVETLAEAQRFQAKFPPTGVVWEVEATRYVRSDMTFTSGISSPLVASYFARCYWAGQPRPSSDAPSEPWWELLLTPPVTVVRRVDAVLDIHAASGG